MGGASVANRYLDNISYQPKVNYLYFPVDNQIKSEKPERSCGGCRRK